MLIIIALVWISEVISIGIPLHKGKRCMLIQGGLDVNIW